MDEKQEINNVNENEQVKDLKEVLTSNLANFWMRIVALTIDYVIFKIIGFAVLGIFLIFARSFIVELGEKGMIFGFVVSLCYLGIMNSKIFGGQTVGKKITKIKVVDKNGENIGVLRSTFRALFLLIPFFMHKAYDNVPIKDRFSLLLMGLILSAAVIFFIGLAYFYIFNKYTRQSIHDLVLGTFVVKKDVNEINIEKRIPGKHFVIFSIIAVFVLIIFAGGMYLISGKLGGKYYNLVSDLKSNNNLSVNITENTNWTPVNHPQTGKKTNKTLSVIVSPGRYDINRGAVVGEVRDKILSKVNALSSFDFLGISIFFEGDVGFARYYEYESYSGTISDWKTKPIKNLWAGKGFGMK
ncbi:MAG: RDD family protein [bacterium]|nr:RDD family protein [bacterium]